MQSRLFAATTVHRGEDVSFNSIMKKCNLADPALVLLGEIVRAGIRIAPICIRLKKIWVRLLAADHEILEREFFVYDALYPKCQRRVSRGLVAEVS